MDEKERYKSESYMDAFSEIHDTQLDIWYLRKDLIVELLNNQDKRIKELEQENLFFKEQNKSLIDEEEHISKKMQEVGFDNIEDLCKTQKQVHTETITVDSGLTVNNSLTISSEMEGNKVYIWGYELCKGSEWKDFLEVANRLGEENKRLKEHIEHIENIKAIEFIDAIQNYEQQIREFKQSQKQLAIEKLERLKNYFCEEDEDGDGIKTGDWTITHDACEIAEFIDEQLKELKGGEDKK